VALTPPPQEIHSITVGTIPVIERCGVLKVLIAEPFIPDQIIGPERKEVIYEVSS